MSHRKYLAGTAFVFLFLFAAAWAVAEDRESAGLERDRVAFAREIERAVNARDAAFVDARVDAKALVDRVLQGLTLSKDSEAEVREGISSNLGIGQGICAPLGDGGIYTFLRLKPMGADSQAVFRSIVADRFAYHELTLAGGGDKPVRITDVYGYLGGERVSATWRRLVLPMLAAREQGFLRTLAGKESEFVANASMWMQMQQRFQARRFPEALGSYMAMPASMREEKMVLLLRLKCAEQVGGFLLEDALADILRLFGDDPAMSLALLYPYAARKDYEKALQAIDRLDKGVGGDPQLHVQRAAIYRLQGKPKESKAAAEKALQAEPTLAVAYWHLISLALDEKNFAEVARCLTLLETELHLPIPDLAGEAPFAEFVKSKEYAGWLKTRRREGAGGDK